MLNEMKVAELEEDNQKHKSKIRDLHNKLETAMMEIRKNQNLAVPKSPKKTSSITNTDINSISVQDSTTPTRAAETNSPNVSLKNDNRDKTNQNSSYPSPSMLSPEKFTVKDFEDLINSNATGDKAGNEKILSHFQKLKTENQAQHQKIVRLKGEQMKACEIIKNMIASRNKANEDINQLKAHVKELEHELESVVTRPVNDTADTVSLKQKITDLNIKAVVSKSEDEVDICKKVARAKVQKFINRKKS